MRLDVDRLASARVVLHGSPYMSARDRRASGRPAVALLFGLAGTTLFFGACKGGDAALPSEPSHLSIHDRVDGSADALDAATTADVAIGDAHIADAASPSDAADANAKGDADSAVSVDADAAPAGDGAAADAADGSVPKTAFCELPGSIVYTANGVITVPNLAGPLPDVSYIKLPPGFCVHYFANVGNARQLRVAPGGELFVASPTTGTTGGGPNGQAAIVVVPDDDHDGLGDSPGVFIGGLASTQGLMFVPGFLYYQEGTQPVPDSTEIMRVPYNSGDRVPSGASTVAMKVDLPQAAEHWPKVFDIADDGTIYVTNGGSQSDRCVSARPFLGGILKMDGTLNGSLVAKGFRNPIALRCHHGFNVCLAAELALDYSSGVGGHEKLTAIAQGDDWGYPCCATKNVPYTGTVYADTHQAPDCSGVVSESNAFLIGHTPFGFDFAPNTWPAPYAESVFLALHGFFSTWVGARMVAIATDPFTGLPVASSEDGSGSSNGSQVDFATGWDDGRLAHGRPAAVTFGPDGRLYLGNDIDGTIVWIAPVGLPNTL